MFFNADVKEVKKVFIPEEKDDQPVLEEQPNPYLRGDGRMMIGSGEDCYVELCV